MGKFFITGCSGSLGKRLSCALLAKGNQVCGLDIIPPAEGLTQNPNFEFRKADITDFEAVSKGMAGSDVGIHCAALLPQKDYLGLQAYLDTNAKGAENFLTACLKNNIKKAVIISASGVLKPNRKGITFDSTEYRQSTNFYIKSKIEAEKLIDRLQVKEKIDYLILRPAAIYGIGMDYKWREIFDLAQKNRLFVIYPGDQLYSIIHVDDFIDAILLSVTKLNKGISGEKILITSSDKLTINDILLYISKYFSAKPPIKVPFFAAFAAAKIVYNFGKITKNGFLSSIHPENILDYKSGLFFDSKKAFEFLGFESKIKFEVEMPNILRNYKKVK